MENLCFGNLWRDGYEADKNDIVVMDLASKKSQILLNLGTKV